MMAEMKAIWKAGHKEMKAHQESIMALMKAGLEEMKSIAEHQDVPKEATVETIGAVENRYGDWHLAVGCHRQPKKWTQGDCGSQKKLATTHRGMTCHAVRDVVIKGRRSRRDDGKGEPRTMLY
jgi:hypothetical protein